MNRTVLAIALSSVLWVAPSAMASSAASPAPTPPAGSDVLQDNPFFEAQWATPFGAVPFDRIRVEHFEPAFEHGMAENLKEIEIIATQVAAPNFENTIAAMERSGRKLSQVSLVFFNLTPTNSNDAIRAIQTRMAPRLAAHQNRILLDPRLFARVQAAYAGRDEAGLTAEQRRVTERYHLEFIRAGAALTEAQRQRVAEIGLSRDPCGTDLHGTCPPGSLAGWKSSSRKHWV